MATEQAMLVLMRYEVQHSLKQSSLWNDVGEYDAKVRSGNWLVPRLQIRARRPVPVEDGMDLEVVIISSRLVRRAYVVEFAGTSAAGVSSAGTGVFVQNVPIHDPH